MQIYKGAAKRIDDIDLVRVGKMIKVGEDEIHAVLDVESSGSGFDKDGRVKALFEPHIFYKVLPGAKLGTAVTAGLAYPKWGEQRYPRSSYDRIDAAMAIDAAAALKATSWGLGQILGLHFSDLGYATPKDMVKAFADDEEAQLKGIVDFIRVNRLDDELRAHNWAAFARGYNGPGYAKNRYDIKLAEAFSKWQAIRDTPDTETASGHKKEPPKPIPPATITVRNETVIEKTDFERVPWWKKWL